MSYQYTIDVEHKETHRYYIKAGTMEEAKEEALRLYKEERTPGSEETVVLCQGFCPNFKKV